MEGKGLEEMERTIKYTLLVAYLKSIFSLIKLSIILFDFSFLYLNMLQLSPPSPLGEVLEEYVPLV